MVDERSIDPVHPELEDVGCQLVAELADLQKVVLQGKEICGQGSSNQLTNLANGTCSEPVPKLVPYPLRKSFGEGAEEVDLLSSSFVVVWKMKKNMLINFFHLEH